MLIENDANRWQRLLVSGVLFVVVGAMVYKNTMLIGTLDSVLQALFTERDRGNEDFDDVDFLFG